MSNWGLIDKCLYNFLGYGNLNGRYWFIGTEEGGAEIWRFGKLSLEESLNFRNGFKIAMDFCIVWEDIYGIPLEMFKGPTTWRFIAAFLLAFQGIKPSSDLVQQYVFYEKKLGSINSEHFMCEYLPLPKRGKGKIEPYESVWKTNKQYTQEVGPKRRQLIIDTIQMHPGVKIIISYDRQVSGQLLNYVKAQKVDEWILFERERYSLWELQLNPTMSIYLLNTPFFGQGQISYDGIYAISKYLHEIC